MSLIHYHRTSSSFKRLYTSSSIAPDTILLNGLVWSGLTTYPITNTAISIKGNKILSIGNTNDIYKTSNKHTNIIDCKNKLIVPGFTDSHIHFLMGGERLTSVQLAGVKTKEEFIKRIKEFALVHPKEWIIGGDWDHTLWGGELPERSWIDSVTPNNPVWLNRKEGHMYLANSLAMKLANVQDDEDAARELKVTGGTIVRNPNGKMTGLFKDNAIDLIYKHVPKPTEKESLAALQAATNYATRNGVTSIHHMTEPPNRNRGGIGSDYEVFKLAHSRDILKTRVYCAWPIHDWDKLRDYIKLNGRGDDWLKIGSVKGYVDGSLGSHSAAFLEEYTDTPGYRGDIVNNLDHLYSWVQNVDAAGLQVCIHSIGDAANRHLLDIYEKVAKFNGPRDRRWRNEHAQHINDMELSRFNKLGVISSVQPYHAIDDGRFAEIMLGSKRVNEAYPFRSMLNNGALLAFGSDWFVAPVEPLTAIAAAVTRETIEGGGKIFAPNQRISVSESLYAHCVVPAYASFDENIKGTIAPGKLADIAVIDKNLFTMPIEELKYAQVVMTLLDGKIVYQKHENEKCSKLPVHDSSLPCPACFGAKKL